MKKLFLLSLAQTGSRHVASIPIEEPEDYVNVLAGTHGSEAAQKARSSGNALPIVARPWGFNHWAPQTTDRSTSWWFDADVEEFHGIRCTHQPSPWIGDWGWFVLLPAGDRAKELLGFTSYHPVGAIRPYLLDLLTGPHGVGIELTPTMHGALMRVTFPESVPQKDRRVCGTVPVHAEGSEERRAEAAEVKTGDCQVDSGGFDLRSRRFAFGVPQVQHFALYARVEAPNTEATAHSDGRTCCLELLDGRAQIEVRIGTSLISGTQAGLAIERELGSHSFDEMVTEARHAWRSSLKRIHVVDPGPPTASTHQRLEIFYTGLYRALLFPRLLDEDTRKGKHHWSPYDGKVREGPGASDNGFWDTFRTVYPLLSLAYPRELGQLLEGWVNAYRAGGWLPQWSSPGYRGSMCGTYGEVVLADAMLKNISGFNYTTAWEVLRKESFEAFPDPKDTTRGKHGFSHYTQSGYIPNDVQIENSCTETLDLAHADAAVAAVAARLGHVDDASTLRERSLRALRSLYNPKARLMQGRNSGGSFRESAPNEWGHCWAEGAPWQQSFPPFNMAALEELYEGRAKLLERLKELFAAPGDFKHGSYGREIHEMREMQMLGMGQYAHNNQPSHHLPYLFTLLGDHNETARIVRKVLWRAYSTDGYSGDEDNGEMGAWYVLSALGLYATSVGTSEDYVLGAVPLFPRVHLQELDLIIEAPSASKKAPPVVEVLWSSKPLREPTISYSTLRQGGVLRFVSPGDSHLGKIVSSLRGKAHHVAHHLAHHVAHHVHKRAPKVAKIVSDTVADTSIPPWQYLLGVLMICAFLFKMCGRSKAAHKD